MPYPRKLITCPWCNRPVAPAAARMRLHQSESTAFIGNTLATFHPECGDALLDMLEERTAQSEVRMTTAKGVRFLTVDECRALGVEPYAIYGGKVHSFKRTVSRDFLETIPYGSKCYASYVAEADKLERNP